MGRDAKNCRSITFVDLLASSATALKAHALRTGLTMLGIIIGVGAIVAMISIGLGARAQVEAEISRLGSNLLMVASDIRPSDSVQSGTTARHTLTQADADAIAMEIPGITDAVGVVTGKVQVVHGNRNWETRLVGSEAEYLGVREWALSAGRNFSRAESAGAAKVIILGRTVSARLAPQDQLLGRIVRVGSVPFRVIGILEAKGFSVVGGDQDDVVIVPMTSAKSRLIGSVNRVDRAAVEYIFVKVENNDTMAVIGAEIERVLTHRHRASYGRDDKFIVRDPAAALLARRKSSDTLTLLLGCVAAVSLVVGGISVMNIMLVSVVERTREIGIRIAVGARRSDIRRQFLIESGVMALAGGVVGAAAGAAVAVGVAALTHWQVTIAPWAIGGSIVFAGLVGVIAGVYPANRAAGLDPVEALRRE